ncbi:hypothetical protein [Chryseosolibacter indicus]|uniref:Uncharacterized protein n=1 Tax=Chryseosolibacter indicus TaxID=2782351 RepID=A0ABS5VJZ5_9BACT|nr:hypothetical protein [Chryseosolibacter indicus]MBT1701706.1 hypothetical protein [Chryseosolibacter indicus]
MALVRENDLTEGLSGKFGSKMAFKQLRGKTIVARRAKPTTKESQLQKDNRARFRLATQYAKAMMLDPERKAYYWRRARKLKLPNAYTAAIADYMRKPRIDEVKVSVEGKSVAVHVRTSKEDFKMRSINVAALDEGGVVEEKRVDGFKELSCRFANERGLIVKVLVVAADEAGNVVMKEVVVAR